MERLKSAIAKARQSANENRLAPTPHATWPTGSPPPAADRSTAPVARSGAWLLPLLLVAAAALGFWVVKPGPERPSKVAALRTDAAPEPQASAPLPTTSQPERPEVASAASAVVEPAERSGLPPEKQVEAAVEDWRDAWSSRDMERYLDIYSDAFVPGDGTTRDAWIASRYRNVGGRTSIEITVRNLQVSSIDGNRVRASFLQDYASGSYQETGQPKTLDWVLEEDNRWRIAGEWQGDAPPASPEGTT